MGFISKSSYAIVAGCTCKRKNEAIRDNQHINY